MVSRIIRLLGQKCKEDTQVMLFYFSSFRNASGEFKEMSLRRVGGGEYKAHKIRAHPQRVQTEHNPKAQVGRPKRENP